MSFIITVQNLTDLQEIIFSKINLIDKDALSLQEVHENVYGFDMTDDCAISTTLKDLKKITTEAKKTGSRVVS